MATVHDRGTALALPVSSLHGVGPRVTERLARLGIERVQDVLFHLPLRYEDRTRISPLGGLQMGQEVQIQATVELAQVSFGRRRSLLVRISDGTGALILRFFHFSRQQQAQFIPGRAILCYGEVRRGQTTLEMVHPEYQFIEAGDSAISEPSLTPIYPTTEGLHQLSLRKLSEQAITQLRSSDGGLNDFLPASLIRCYGFPSLQQALLYVHRPPVGADTVALLEGRHPAQQRLAFEELLAHQLSMGELRQRVRAHAAPPLSANATLGPRLRELLPFRLTAAQERISAEISADLAQSLPMLRLVQGDVGSGKTVVAALAALQTIENGYQAAVMAPTELLAEQHRRTFEAWFETLAIPVHWLGGKLGRAQRRETLAALAAGLPELVIGTHALFQDDVELPRLGLCIIDEQHRFGVHQRLSLRDKGRRDGLLPHQLIMTATPIPRTLAMTAYADLDTSIIDELPPGRTPVATVVIPDSRRAEIIMRIEHACREGRQVYWVCTLIEESDALQCQAATDTAALLTEALPEVRVGLVHGRMKAADKEAAMRAFSDGGTDLLVATTVIEVGVDVPNASLMVIENAERLGLAQLHQLRGRVGRGAIKSDCVLLYHPPLSRPGKERLAIMRESNDGFVIAQRDLELRGPGELLGTRQAGLMQFRIADLARDQSLLQPATEASTWMQAHCPENIPRLVHRWLGNTIHYGDV